MFTSSENIPSMCDSIGNYGGPGTTKSSGLLAGDVITANKTRNWINKWE